MVDCCLAHSPEAIAARRSCAFEPGFALTANALIRTEKRDPNFSLCSAMPLYSHEIAQGITPRSALANDPNIVRDCPEMGAGDFNVFES